LRRFNSALLIDAALLPLEELTGGEALSEIVGVGGAVGAFTVVFAESLSLFPKELFAEEGDAEDGVTTDGDCFFGTLPSTLFR